MLSWTEILSGIMMALDSLRQNKFRSFLTILGVLVGVGSVIALASVIDGLSAAVVQEIDSIGSNTIMITKLPFDVDRDELSDEDRNRPPITIGEARAIQKNCPSVDGVSPQNFYFKPGGNEVKYKNRKGNNPRLMGTWPDYSKVNNTGTQNGRFLTDLDEDFRAMVCVVGAGLAKALFEEEEPIDKEIRVNGYRFVVVGVLDKKESSLGNDGSDNIVIMPLSTYGKLHPWEEELFLMVRASSYDKIDKAHEEVIGALRQYRRVPFNKVNNFALSTQDQMKEQMGEIIEYLYLAMIIITSVGLMVGGIGVMNIMLVSVTERTREIGVRKAIGAKRINIVLQFLTEAMTLSGVGGLMGIIVGSGLGLLINSAAGWPLTLSVFWIVLGFTVSVTVGLLSGIYPAVKAAWLDPIDALRYE